MLSASVPTRDSGITVVARIAIELPVMSAILACREMIGVLDLPDR
jgi:hypothetical protein